MYVDWNTNKFGILEVMNMEFISELFMLAGDILVAVVVFNVHGHVLKEKRIDKDVLDTIRGERWLVVLGIALVLIGFAMRWITI